MTRTWYAAPLNAQRRPSSWCCFSEKTPLGPLTDCLTTELSGVASLLLWLLRPKNTHTLSSDVLMGKTLIMGVRIWMCFSKGTSARLYKHCTNLQEATKVMTPPPPPPQTNHVGPLTSLSTNTLFLFGPEDSEHNGHLILILTHGNRYTGRCRSGPWEQSFQAWL